MTGTAVARTGRSPRGKFEADEHNAQRDAEAARLRARGWSYKLIADHMGYADHSGPRRAVHRALQTVRSEDAEDALQLELARLDMSYHAALLILESQHFVVSASGRIVHYGNEPVTDHGAVLQALDRMLRITQERAKLLGLYAPSKQNIHVLTEDMLDAELRRLNEELAKRGADPVTVDS